MALYEKLLAGQEEASPQAQASFFNLPAEIRSEIYDLAYPENLLHIARYIAPPQQKRRPYFCAYWCVAIGDFAKGYSHPACQWYETPRKHMLGLPLTCRRLYLDTIQRVYSRHTMHFRDEDLALEWQKRTPKAHLDAVTSICLSSVIFYPSDTTTYDAIWDFLASLPSLERLAVRIEGCETQDEWVADRQRAMAAPIKKIQQSTLQSFDLIYNIGGTWFPDDYYLRIEYNGLNWDTFTVDRDMFPVLFDGLHPCCRVVGMNGFIFNRPVRDDMPTTAQLNIWFSWFSCNSAYGAEYPPGYDLDEVGPRHAAVSRALADGAAACGLSEKEYQAKQKEHARQEKFRIDEDYLSYENGGDGTLDDPLAWDLVELNRVAELNDPDTSWPRLGRWNFPEKPSWIMDGTLDKRHESPPMHYPERDGGEESDQGSEYGS